MSATTRTKRIRLARTIDGLFDLSMESGRTDAANAARFIERYHTRLLFVPQWNRWLTWDRQRWSDDSGVGVMQLATRYARSLWIALGAKAEHLDRDELGPLQTFVKSSNQAGKILSFLGLAKYDERVVCSVDELNTKPTRLNVLNGTIDLESGCIRKHDPDDRLTQLAQVEFDSAATCPEWLHTLELVFQGDAQLIRYVQKLLGYSISGDTAEHILPICYGSGCNGKSTIWNTITAILGDDYAMLADESLLLGDANTHPTDKASLYQKRFVAISEPERGSKLRESRVKELTGDRTITARRMREDFWSFARTHTFWLSTNHLPRIDGIDLGIWRRVKLIPFKVDLSKVTTEKKDFDKWLAANESSGILNWLVEGYRAYRLEGLAEPTTVRQATDSYRVDSDPLAEFIADHCVTSPSAVSTANELFNRYQATGGKWSKTAFGRAIAERFERVRSWEKEHRGKWVYRGIRPATETDENAGDLQNAPGCTGFSQYPIEICADSIAQSKKLGATRCIAPLPDPTCPCGGEIFGGLCSKCDAVIDPAAIGQGARQ